MKKISVVILNWNGEAMLRQFLPSVIAYSEAEGVEVCVADNASSDASCDVVRKEFPAVRLIELEENYGFAEGYNRALQQVDAEYVVLLNSDIEVTPHWLEPLRDFMEVHPEVAACQPKLLSQRNKEFLNMRVLRGGISTVMGILLSRTDFETVEKDGGQYDTVMPVFGLVELPFCPLERLS